MSHAELKSLVDRCTRTEQRYLLAYLRTKHPAYRRKLKAADRAMAAGQTVRLRAARSEIVHIAN